MGSASTKEKQTGSGGGIFEIVNDNAAKRRIISVSDVFGKHLHLHLYL